MAPGALDGFQSLGDFADRLGDGVARVCVIHGFLPNRSLRHSPWERGRIPEPGIHSLIHLIFKLLE
ncbi:hypothetical protein GCM10023161_28660 [Mycobacterium paraffinicum]|uniref:Uncharacterized protein n=1 Tax=Mycobacterium paraffinicum TaxID=53378 RepID=A0ABP8RNA5_9MYCO